MLLDISHQGLNIECSCIPNHMTCDYSFPIPKAACLDLNTFFYHGFPVPKTGDKGVMHTVLAKQHATALAIIISIKALEETKSLRGFENDFVPHNDRKRKIDG